MTDTKKRLAKIAVLRLKEVEASLARAEREVRVLREERDAVKVLARSHAHARPSPNGRHSVPEGTEKPMPGAAVLALVKTEPGITVRDIVNRLEGNIKTTSENQRRLLTSTVDVLVRRTKKLRKDEEGRVFPA